jgi:hypothetical protein
MIFFDEKVQVVKKAKKKALGGQKEVKTSICLLKQKKETL